MLLAMLPVDVSRIYHRLMTKSLLYAHEPTQWLGGTMAEIPKGRNVFGKNGNISVDAFRGVCVADQIGKAFHRVSRSVLMRTMHQFIPETSFGGMAGRGTEFASHLLRLSQSMVWKRNRTSVSIFVDVVFL